MLPFNTYSEARDYFGIDMPRQFIDQLFVIDNYCRANNLDTLSCLFDVFGILRLEGNSARYQQTPVEFFPIGSTGSDGEHYGYIMHTDGEPDYPSAELCPMDSDGAVVIGHDTQSLLQNLLCDESAIDSYKLLIEKLGLRPVTIHRKRYDGENKTLRIAVEPKQGWRFVQTADGAGVFAEEKYFNEYHEEYDTLKRMSGIEPYEYLAAEMKEFGYYGSQLYYLKQLYWFEWTNYTLAVKCLTEMQDAYQHLSRPHLVATTKWLIDTFSSRYGV